MHENHSQNPDQLLGSSINVGKVSTLCNAECNEHWDLHIPVSQVCCLIDLLGDCVRAS
jgi:hypothetical protein